MPFTFKLAKRLARSRREVSLDPAALAILDCLTSNPPSIASCPPPVAQAGVGVRVSLVRRTV